jgi:hypothetical protein
MTLPPGAKLEVSESEGLSEEEQEEIFQRLSVGIDFSDAAEVNGEKSIDALSEEISEILKRKANVVVFSGPEGEATFYSRSVLQIKYENLRILIFVGLSKI